MNEPRKVMIVDDEESVRDLLRITLEVEEDFEIVAEAEDGVEALSLALKHHPDYVILDYSMPRMNGEEAARVLRGMHTGACIIAFSAFVNEQPDWADAYLTKDRFRDIVSLLRSLEPQDCGVKAERSA